MAVCVTCNKKSRRISWSRHQKGSSGASEWPLRAQIVKRSQKPNLHIFKGKEYCTKCLRVAKEEFNKKFSKEQVVASPQA
jgi:hypothetical protein